MRSLTSSLLIFILCQTSMGEETTKTLVSDYDFKVPPHAKELLDFNCFECHDDDRKKGDVQLDNLEDLSQPARLELLNKVLEQVYSGEMPPRKADQPTEKERDALAGWVLGELKIFNASKLGDKLRYYRYGNYVNHDKLFRGDIKTAAFSPSRRWKINEMIYQERINDVFELTGRARKSSFYGVVKPFSLPTESGVRYYDNQAVEGGQFLTLLSNAQWVVDRQLRATLLKTGEYQHSKEYLKFISEKRRNLNLFFPAELWNLGRTAEPFKQVIMNKGVPSDDLLAAAITHQFKGALQREPTSNELSKYLKFTKDTMKKSDKTSALKQMMVSIIMETEFLYRNELGDGKPDSSGRKMLNPHDASYAIAYALTDRVPDKALVKAVEAGKLSTRKDYERELRRILADDSIDKPRILRFFQDYFGYQGIYDVFKDEERFVGNYNPSRRVSTRYDYRVPGKISKEADALVEWILRNDKDVLKTLLTTDKFFVHHNGNNQEMAKRAKTATLDYATFRTMQKRLRGLEKSQWHEEMMKMHKEMPKLRLDRRFLSKSGNIRGILATTLKQAAIYFGKDGKKDENSNKVYMPHDREHIPHSIKMYNLDYLEWSYVVEQPFKLENRTGILTHPAWLVSFTHNAATDPILRGKWIREKLLGGFIADVPITVDAKVPDDPHKTLRERFSITEAKKCWFCHEKMNPLGHVFESYDDFGRFRTEEQIEYPENIIATKTIIAKGGSKPWQNYKMPVYKTKPVNSLGYLDGTGDKSLDGKVKNASDLMNRLAKSDRVRQVFIRHVFRYFMGRNETLSDSQTLIKADKAYLESGGSFKELMVSILTSDSFIYRK